MGIIELYIEPRSTIEDGLLLEELSTVTRLSQLGIEKDADNDNHNIDLNIPDSKISYSR